MVGWHWFNGHEFEQAPGDSEGQGSLVLLQLGGAMNNERGTRRTKWFWETLLLTVCLFHNVWEMLIKDHFILKSWLLEFLPWMLVPLWDSRMWVLVSLRRYGRGADGGPEMLHFIPVLDWYHCASEVCFSLTVRSRAQVAGLETLEQWPNLKVWSTKSCKLRDNVLVCVH